NPPGLVVVLYYSLFLAIHLCPEIRTPKRSVFIREAKRVVKVELYVPINPAVGIPLLILTLLVKGEKLVPAFIISPVEDCLSAVTRYMPLGLFDRQCVNPATHLLPRVPPAESLGNPNTMIVAEPGGTAQKPLAAPEATATYCFPFTAYVITPPFNRPPVLNR